MTTFYSSVGHHRRTSSLPVFDDPPTFSKAEGGWRGGGLGGGQVERKESLIFKRNLPSSPPTPQTPRRSGEDYWSKRGLTTARSGEIVSSGTSRRNSETQPSNIDDHVFTQLGGSTPRHTGTTPFKVIPLGSMDSGSPTRAFHWSSSSTTKLGGPGQLKYSSTLDHPRSPSTLDTRKFRGMADTDDGGLSRWEDSFQKFIFSASPSDDWKKKFLYQDQEPKSRCPSGGETFGQRSTLTRLSGDGTVSRNIGSQRGYVSDSEDSWNWLEKQREKLASKRTSHNLSHQRLDLEDQLTRQSSEVEQKLLAELRASQSSLRGRVSASDLRYRARSMDNVGLNTDEYDINYSKFGPSFQRKSSTLRSRGLGVANGASLGSGERPGYQTLPRGASLQKNSSRERPPLGQTRYSMRTLRPREERFNQLPGDASTDGRSSTGRNMSGVSAKKQQDKGGEEEITLRPIGPGIQPLESPDLGSMLTRFPQKHLIQSIDGDNIKISADVPPIVFTPASPINSSISTLPPSAPINRSTALNETLPLFNTGTGSPSVSCDVRSNVGGDEIVVEQAIKPGGKVPESTVFDNVQTDRSRETSIDVYRNDHSSSRSMALKTDQPKTLVDSVYTTQQRQGQQQRQPQQQLQQQQPQYEWSAFRELSTADQPERYSGVTNWQNDHSTMNAYRTQPAIRVERTVPLPQDFSVVQQDQKYLTMQNNQTSKEGHRTSENLTNQLDFQQLNAIRGYEGMKQLPNGQQKQLFTEQQQIQIEQQLKDLERQQLLLLEQQQRLQEQLQLLGLNASNVQPQQLLGQQVGQKEQQLVQLEQLKMHGQRSSGQPFQQQLLVQQRTPHEQQQVQQPQLKEQQVQRGNLMQQQHQDGQPVVYMASRDNRPFGFQGQQQPQQHSQQYLQPVAPVVQHVPSTDNQAFQSLRRETPFIQNIHSFTSPSPPYGSPGSPQNLPFQLSSSQSQRDGSSASRFQSLSNEIQRQESEPVSPTGASSQIQAAKLEIVHPTYNKVATSEVFSSSTASSRPRASDDMNFPVYGTVIKSSASGVFHSDGSPKLDAGTPSNDQRYLLQQGPIATPQTSFGLSSFVGAKNLENQSGTIQMSPPDGLRVGSSGTLIMPESYWIKQTRPDGNNISTTSSVGSALTPLTVDVGRTQRWTGGTIQGQSSPSFYADRSSAGSLSSSRDDPVHASVPLSVSFVKDTSHLWYKPHLSRDEVIGTLKDKAVGSFIVRDSNTYPGSFALAVKVASVPVNASSQQKYPEGDPSDELVRHFLIEPTPTGVRLKGYKNESVFGSLAALIYQHSITPLSLPCRLRLPSSDANVTEMSRESDQTSSSFDQLVYCAFNVLYLTTVGIELLTGPVALEQVTSMALEGSSSLKTAVVNLKITTNGVTLTDNNRILFFRRHFPADMIRYCGLDRRLRCWTYHNELTGQITKNKIFGLVSRRSGLSAQNECHLFAELDSNQNASSTIISFVNQITQERDRK